ncbi:hypothetical protein GTP45_05545 [Pseudoduganella sp. FT55W]|uniref:Colicin import membrane protein n=1 Tax=Duganella rivi TaxID=2666083 RepID=A0A7X4GML3_9BURK|nr:hypothetical protein [Duganella rivi]MYM66300.1 hypothetical protein [Duganella rivi]
MKALIALLGALVVNAQAQNVTSVEQANAALIKVAQDRAAVHEEFAASERECSTKFFVNNCLDKAKEKRRVALAALRATEVDAQHFKRADSVAKRDADLAERARKDAEEAALRAAQPPKPPHEEKEPPKAPTGPRVADREAEHEAKLKRLEQEAAAGAAKRAANVEAFEKKKAESERRQAEVERRKAENAAKAEKAAARAEADKKKAEAQPAPAK